MTDEDFRDAYQRHKDIVYRFVFRMTASSTEAEDIVQDCFVTFWRKPEAYDPRRGALRSFLIGVARNLVLKHWRRDRRQDELPADEDLEFDSITCQPFEVPGQAAGSVAESVKKAVLLLPPLQREALILAEYEDLSLDEIALATSAELAAVKSRLHRARQNLKRMLQPLLVVERKL